MAFLHYLTEARDLFFKRHQPAQAEEAAKAQLETAKSPEECRAVNELLALIYRSQRRFEDAYTAYEQIQDHYQAGYCALLLGDISRVQQQWTHVLTKRQNHWCASLFGMSTRQLQTYPTLLEIRNHIESDIANLIGASRLDYLENLLAHVDFLTQLNMETPKFAGRALLNAGWIDRAEPYLRKGQKTLPNDPEIYFHLGQYHTQRTNTREARLSLKQCLLISPTYVPARELLEKLPPELPRAGG